MTHIGVNVPVVLSTGHQLGCVNANRTGNDSVIRETDIRAIGREAGQLAGKAAIGKIAVEIARETAAKGYIGPADPQIATNITIDADIRARDAGITFDIAGDNHICPGRRKRSDFDVAQGDVRAGNTQFTANPAR